MHGLKRDRADVRYRAYLETKDVTDENGKLTGEKIRIYADPRPIYGSVSTSGNEVSQQIFGTSLDYDYAIISHEKNLSVKEDDLIFIEEKTCRIRKISKSPNVTAIAVREVSVDGP